MSDEASERPQGDKPNDVTDEQRTTTVSAGVGPGSEPNQEQPSEPAESTQTSHKAESTLSKFRRRKRKQTGKRSSFWRELPVLLVVAIVLAVLIKTFLVQAFFIPSSSMEKTLHGCDGCSGDRVLVNKLTYRFHDPRPGDIVVFKGPPSWQDTPEFQVSEPSNVVSKFFRAIGQAIGVAQPSQKDFVKRVIATGGQTVACCDVHGNVTVDGRSLNEPYIYQNSPDVDSTQCATGRKFGPYTIPKGRLWVMGDHRDDSSDSRCHVTDQYHGTIGVSDVIGKAFVTVWPPSRWTTLGTPATFKDSDAAAQGQLVAPLLLVGSVAAGPLWVRRRRRRRR